MTAYLTTWSLNIYCRQAWCVTLGAVGWGVNNESPGFAFKDCGDNWGPAGPGVLTTDLLTDDGPEPVDLWMKGTQQ